MKKRDKVVDLKIFRKKKQDKESSVYYKNFYNDKFLTHEESEYLLDHLQKDDNLSDSVRFKYITAVCLLILIATTLTVFLLASILQW